MVRVFDGKSFYWVPPSGGSLEIGNIGDSGFDGLKDGDVPPSGGSLEIGNEQPRTDQHVLGQSSPFGGIPRNWKPYDSSKNMIWLWQGFPLRGDP